MPAQLRSRSEMTGNRLVGKRRSVVWPVGGILAAGAILISVLVCATNPPAVAPPSHLTSSGPGWPRTSPVVSRVWSYSAVQDAAGSAVFLLDALGERFLELSLEGRATNLVPVSGHVGRILAEGWPDAVARQGDDLVVHLQIGDRLLRVGRELNVRSSISLADTGRRGAAALESMPLWDVTAGGDIIACGDLQGDDGEWHSGFYRLPADPAGAIAGLITYDPRDPLNIYCRLGVDLITTIGETAYFIVMEDPPCIYRQNPGDSEPQKLEAFPPLAGPPPVLPALRPREEYAALMQQVEDSDMVVGLYSHQASLYLLYRHHHNAGLSWLLSQIDPETDKEVGTICIPSGANHLMIAPGRREWVFIEKGPVKSLGFQDLRGILRVPFSEIQTSISKSQNADVDCGRR